MGLISVFHAGFFLMLFPLFSQDFDFSPYTQRIAGSQVVFQMAAIPAGQFIMGSPDKEKGRSADEGPQREVRVDAFWMSRHEVTWAEFEQWVYEELDHDSILAPAGSGLELDAITRPTPPYFGIPSGKGQEHFPAAGMTQYAAQRYCQWLSQKTGHFYRLPTEAEWEYACRAGSQTSYSFGKKAKDLDDYGHFEQDDVHIVGQLAANAWGLFDMHGNVAEWTLDQYSPAGYALTHTVLVNPVEVPDKLYPRVVRGGAYDEEASACRCAARRGSSPKWKIDDPQLPKSLWWHTRAGSVGFRVVRPLKPPIPDDIREFWPEPISEY